jgi:predicted permease
VSWWSRKQREQDLERELRSDLELEAEELRESGLSLQDAQCAARRAFGNATYVKEEVREMLGWTWVERLFQDLRYGLRTMRRSPGFASVAVLSLALGIGANTSIFTLINVLMLRSLPVREPEQLVEVLRNSGDHRGNAFSWQSYQYLRDHSRTLSELMASHRDRLYMQVQGLEAEKVEGQYVTGNYFSMLGLRPALGRLIGAEDDHMGSPAAVAVVSWQYWKSRLGLDPGILGRKITIESVPVTIVGVTPAEFLGLQVGWSEDIFVPLALEPLIRHPSYTSDAGYKWLQLMGRMRPSSSLGQVGAEMNVLFRETLRIEDLDIRRPEAARWRIEIEPAGAGFERLREEFSQPLMVLMIIVGLLLLIACANVAGMLLARGTARRREMALRVSLGASRVRLVRQLLTESLLISGIAATLGVILAYFGSDALVRIMKSGRLPIDLEVRPDLRVLLFTAAVSLAAGVVFGIIPAFRATPTSGSGRAGETRSGRVFGKTLIVAQVAFSVVLLTAAGWFVRNLASLEARDMGFRRDHVVMFGLDPSHSGYNDEQLSREYQRLLARLERIPGVRSASIVWMPPISGGGSDGTAAVEGSAVRLYTWRNWVAPRYFETMGIPLVVGREFSFRDGPASPKVAIVNQTLARNAFGSTDPIGRRLRLWADRPDVCEIVGVVGDGKYVDVRENTVATAYLSTFQGRPASTFVIRTAIPPVEILPSVRHEVRGMSKAVVLGKVTTLAAHVDASLVQERLIADLSSIFGALGSLLTAIGLYGLLAYTVARRTNEIGIRMALGANHAAVIAMVLREAALLVSVGLAGGILVSLAARRAAAAAFRGVPPAGALTVALGAAIMILIALVAAYRPARRAARVDPMEALRYE